jgi:chorismate mutase
MTVRGVRGATTVSKDDPQAILDATETLLLAIQTANPSLHPDDIASAFFTTTEDLQSVHPAQAARRLGWDQVPLMCAREIAVPGSLPHCIRILVHWNTELSQGEIQHVYLGEATSLRPDLTSISASSLTNNKYFEENRP